MKLYIALHREKNFNMLLMENLNPIFLSNAYLYNIIFQLITNPIPLQRSGKDKVLGFTNEGIQFIYVM